MASQHSVRRDASNTLRPHWGLAVVAVVALVACPVLLALAAGAETMVHPGPPSLEAAQNALAEAQAARADAIARRAQGQTDLAATRQEISALGLEQAALAHELEIARRRVRVVTVRAYTGGGGARELDVLMDAGDIGEHLYRSELLTGNAVDTTRAIEEYHDLQAQADDHVIELAERVDDLQAGIEQAGADIVQAAQDIRRAQVELSAAQAMGGAGRRDPGEGAWSRLRFCESGGVYTTNSGNGFYGAYQFDLRTWQTMGGTGRPSAAPYWEQDVRAKALYQVRGAQPWPLCGRFLG
jgi:hypothetical protein